MQGSHDGHSVVDLLIWDVAKKQNPRTLVKGGLQQLKITTGGLAQGKKIPATLQGQQRHKGASVLCHINGALSWRLPGALKEISSERHGRIWVLKGHW